MLKTIVLLNIFVETLMNRKKIKFEMEILCNIYNVTFDQFNLYFFFLQSYWPQTFE